MYYIRQWSDEYATQVIYATIDGFDIENEYPPVFCAGCGTELPTIKFIMKGQCICPCCKAWHKHIAF